MMRKHFHRFMAAWLLLLLAVICISPLQSQAAVKKLKPGKTYSVDLNGGKKEKVRYTVKKNSKGQAVISLYVNKKRVLKKTLKGKYDSSQYSEPTALSGVKVADIDKNDKYKELFLDVGGDASDTWICVIRYYSRKKVKFYSRNSGAAVFTKAARVSAYKMSADGSGKAYVEVDTPYYTPGFGCYDALVPMKISGGKMKYYTASSYKLAEVKTYLKAQAGDSYYELKRSMTIYSDVACSEAAASLKKGTKFLPSRVSFYNVKKDSYGSYTADVHVKVKTVDGQSGWLLFPADGSGYLKFTPAWG